MNGVGKWSMENGVSEYLLTSECDRAFKASRVHSLVVTIMHFGLQGVLSGVLAALTEPTDDG